MTDVVAVAAAAEEEEIPGIIINTNKRGRSTWEERLEELKHHSDNHPGLKLFQSLDARVEGPGGGGDFEFFSGGAGGGGGPRSRFSEEQYTTLETKYGKMKREYAKVDGALRSGLTKSRDAERELFDAKVALASKDLEIKRLKEEAVELISLVQRQQMEMVQFAERARQDREQAVRDALRMSNNK